MTGRILIVGVLAGYVATVVAANSLTATFGLVPVGFGLHATAGTYAAGAVLVLRDLLHDTAGRSAVMAAIVVGTALSAAADLRLALASGTAFACSELADLAVYTPLRRRGWARAVAGSNLVGSVLDTLLFLTLAELPVWPTSAGQLVGKAWATAAPILAVVTFRAWRRVVPRQPLDPAGT